LPLFFELSLEIIQPFESVVSMRAKECTMRADFLLVGDANNIQGNLVLGTNLVMKLILIQDLRPKQHISSVLIFFLVQHRLLRLKVAFLAEVHQEGGIEGKDADAFLTDYGRAQPAHDHVLAGLDDLANAGFADVMLAAG
jgi:hypothetical protein